MRVRDDMEGAARNRAVVVREHATRWPRPSRIRVLTPRCDVQRAGLAGDVARAGRDRTGHLDGGERGTCGGGDSPPCVKVGLGGCWAETSVTGETSAGTLASFALITHGSATAVNPLRGSSAALRPCGCATTPTEFWTQPSAAVTSRSAATATARDLYLEVDRPPATAGCSGVSTGVSRARWGSARRASPARQV